MKYFFTILLLALSLTCFAHNQDSINQVQDSINHSLLKELSLLKKDLPTFDSLKQSENYYKYLLEMKEETIKGMSTSLSYILGAIAIILGIFSILFALYVERMRNKINIIKANIDNTNLEVKGTKTEIETTQSEVNDTKTEIETTQSEVHNTKIEIDKTKLEVEKINKKIQENISGLYLQLKQEETKYALGRLSEKPESIEAFYNSLLSQDLQPEAFLYLKEAYLNIKDEKSLPNHSQKIFVFQSLFFNQFLSETIGDEQIKNSLLGSYSRLMKECSKKNIIKIAEEFINGLNNRDLKEYEKNISEFMLELASSRLSYNPYIYKTLYDGLKNKERRFEFFKLIIGKETNSKSTYEYGELSPIEVIVKYFGKYLVENYIPSSLNDEEINLIERVNSLNKTMKDYEEGREKMQIQQQQEDSEMYEAMDNEETDE